MKDASEVVLYIGKAKDLKKRLSSYLQTKDPKTRALLERVRVVEWILTASEMDALITEAQLIREHHPRYNVDLPSTGRYAYIKRTGEPYPRFVVARKVVRGGAYVGPYVSAAARNALLKHVNRIFRFCTSRTRAGTPCLRYHLGLCSGSCASLISRDEYLQSVHDAERFLRGDISSLVNELKEKMVHAARHEQFEKAKMYRDQVRALERILEARIERPKTQDEDVLNYVVQGGELIMQLFHLKKGVISGRKEYTFQLERYATSSHLDVICAFLEQYYATHSIPHIIILPEHIPHASLLMTYLTHHSGRAVVLVVPEKGKRKQLLEVVKKNIISRFGKGAGRLYELERALHLPTIPRRMACIDISTLGGTETVGSLVTFVDGEPRKSDYRRFRIKTVQGVNDVACIKEITERFLRRMHEGKETPPDLFVIDGGRGQVNAAKKMLERFASEIPVIGLAKRLEEVYTTHAKHPLHIPFKSPALQLLRAIRDEAHRFAISYQRTRRRLRK